MHKSFFSLWLIFLLILTGCGGGSDEPSTLLADTGGNPGGTPPAETDNEPQNVTVLPLVQELIPSGGSTVVKLVTFEEIDPDDENPSYVTEPNVTMAVTVIAGNAQLHNVPRSSNPNGEATFTVSHPGSGNVTLNIKGTGRYQGGFLLDLYFGAQVSAELLTAGVIPADGTTAAEIKVFIRDWAGFGIANIPVSLSFPLNSFAVPVQVSGVSDTNGEYTAQITNTVPQATKVTPTAGGLQTNPLTLNFGTSQVVQAPETLDLIVKSNNVLANGQSQATLVVIARDATQAPVPNVPVNISSDSATARLQIGEEVRTLFINSTTGATGRFELDISNTVEGTVNIAAITTSGDTNERSAQQSLIFVAPDDGSSGGTGEEPVGSVVLDNPIDNGQPASGDPNDAVTLRGRVLDKVGNPVADKTVSIIVSGGSAQIEMMNNGSTDVSGRFFATLTNTIVEEFSTRAVVGEVNSNVVNVRFTAIPIEPGEAPPTPPTPPSRITLLASPSSQIANGADPIILTAIVRNNQNVPMEGINVSIAADNNFPSALFDVGLKITDAGGRAVFNLSSQELGSTTVTAQAWVEDADGNIVGSTISDSQVLRFIPEPTDESVVETVTQLDVNVVNNNQPANGQNAIQIDVVARNTQGVAVADAPILVQMSAGKAAYAEPSRDVTNESGFFSTNIKSTEAGQITVTIAVEGLSNVSETRQITFTAQTGAEASLNTVDLEVVNNNQPADGDSKITLIATPRDTNGVPLADINIQLIPESDNVETLTGTTDPLGKYRATMTSTVAESFKVTAVANENVVGDSANVTFTALEDTRNTISLQVENNNQPADGKSTIVLVVKFTDINGNPIPGADVSFIDYSNTVNIIGGTTNAIGEFRTLVSSSVPETFLVIPVVNNIAGTEKSITFVPTVSQVTNLTVSVVTNNQPANGDSPIQIDVIAKDSSGFPVSGAIIEVRLPNEPGSVAAIAKPAQKATDENGLFTTELTSTQAGNVNVNIGVKDSTLPPHTEIVTFVTSPEATSPNSIELQVYDDFQLADGQSTITLVAIPRDVNGTPIPGLPVELLTDSTTAIIANNPGDSNALGEFRTTVTNTVAQTVTVTPVTGGVSGSPVPMTFIPVGEKVADLQVNVIDNNQPMNGENPIRIEVIARDSEGNAVPNVPIVVQVPAGTPAVVASPRGNTSNNGTFSTEIRSSVAGDINLTIAIPGATTVSAQTRTVTFLPVVLDIDKVAELTVTVVESTNNQPADGTEKVRIDVVARDSGGRAIPEVPIVVQMPTGTAAIATPAAGTTATLENGGSFSTEITSTIPGDVAVTISIQGSSIVHPPVIVTFINPTTGLTASTIELIVENAPQPADGASQITLVVIPRDARGNPVPNVNVKLIWDSPAITIANNGEGTTNELGQFRTTVTTTGNMSDTLTDLLEVSITPLIVDGIIGDPTTVVFTPVDVPIPATLSLTVINNNQEVGGEVTLSVLATDVNNFPMGGVPIKLSLTPADAPEPDVTHSVIFNSSFKGNTSGDSGVFQATLTNNLPGIFKVTASVVGVGDVPILNSNTVEVIFDSETGPINQDTSVQLITNKIQLPSGDTEGALITAIIKNKDNNLVEGVTVSFIADSGEIRPISIEGSTDSLPGITDVTGRAQALLTSANPNNRTITVRATVPTTSGEIREDSITIDIVGTILTIDGPGSVVQNAEATFTIALLDSNEKGIAEQIINIKSELANTLNNSAAEISLETDVNGRVQVPYLAINPGEDTLTASKVGAQESKVKITITNDQFTVVPLPASHGRCTSLEDNEDLNNNRILDPGEDVNGNGQLDLGCQIPLGQEQSFEVQWLQGGSPKAFEKVFLSSTRGTLRSDTVSTDINGKATFTLVSANDLGNAIVTVSTSDPAGPSPQFGVKFVALDAASITVQATPPVIGVNLGENDTERSSILAVVRDGANNLVFGKRVDFVLQDITGGRLSQGFDITDDFGRARTEYIAGASASATDGVMIRATVSDIPSVSNTVNLTVAQRGLFVTLGSGNQLVKDEGIRYKSFHTVLVTDSNGTPVNDVLVTLSVYTSSYIKGVLIRDEDKVERQDPAYLCPNEDINRNGILDPGEDINGNGRLDPGNVVTVDNLTLTTGQPNEPNHPDTPQLGYADFDVVYAIDYALWINAEITARVSVEGSEGQSVISFYPTCEPGDFGAELCPELISPFGEGSCDQRF